MPCTGTSAIKNWPPQSRDAARRVIERYGEPDEIKDGQLIWHKRGPWRQIVASKVLLQHNFPAPHYTLFALAPCVEEALEEAARSTAARQAPKRSLRKNPTRPNKIGIATNPAAA